MLRAHHLTTLLSAALALAGCSAEPAREAQPDQAAAKPSLAPRTYPAVSKPDTPLLLDFRVDGDPAAPEITGETNLPDGAHLHVNVAQGDRYMADGADMTVEAGRFHGGPLKLNGDPLVPGNYQIEIGSPVAGAQPDDVRALVGREYENLTGAALVEGRYGRTIEIARPHVVPGPRDRNAEQARDAKRLAEVHAFYQRSCEASQTRKGLPTRTPKAQAAIAECVRGFEAGTPDS